MDRHFCSYGSVNRDKHKGHLVFTVMKQMPVKTTVISKALPQSSVRRDRKNKFGRV